MVTARPARWRRRPGCRRCRRRSRGMSVRRGAACPTLYEAGSPHEGVWHTAMTVVQIRTARPERKPRHATRCEVAVGIVDEGVPTPAASPGPERPARRQPRIDREHRVRDREAGTPTGRCSSNPRRPVTSRTSRSVNDTGSRTPKFFEIKVTRAIRPRHRAIWDSGATLTVTQRPQPTAPVTPAHAVPRRPGKPMSECEAEAGPITGCGPKSETCWEGRGAAGAPSAMSATGEPIFMYGPYGDRKSREKSREPTPCRGESRTAVIPVGAEAQCTRRRCPRAEHRTMTAGVCPGSP